MLIQTPDWVKDAVFYQIFPDRFRRSGRVQGDLTLEPWDTAPSVYGFKGGDLFGVIDKLDYLQSLGVTAIYFTPIFASAANHRYHTYDYYNVDPLLGGNEAFRELIDTAHARDMRIVIDGVFNHASRGFWQFHHVMENGEESPYVDWFHFHPDRLTGASHFAPYPDPKSQEALDAGVGSYEAIGYHAWWNLPALPKFNTDTPAVREFLWSIGTHWVEFGIDGWRLDVPGEIDDDDFWREFRRRVKSVNPDTYIVGEIWHEARRWLQGDQFDAVMNYPITAACMGFFGGDSLNLEEARKPGGLSHTRQLSAAEFADEIDRILDLYESEIVHAQLNLLDSHDMPRFLTCVNGDSRALQMALLFIFTIPGAPCVYYGDEVGVDGSQDPDCRKSFPWDETSWNTELLEHVRQCAKLRQSSTALRRGSFHRLVADHGVFAFARVDGHDVAIVVFNTTGETRPIDIPLDSVAEHVSGQFETSAGSTVEIQHGKLTGLAVAARTGVVATRM